MFSIETLVEIQTHDTKASFGELRFGSKKGRMFALAKQAKLNKTSWSQRLEP
jgi:hypothetical protein